MIFTKSIKYPQTFDLISGSTDIDDTTTSINRCIALILTSAKCELLGDPDFGSRLYEMLFEQYSATLEAAIKAEIVEAITTFEKRVTITEDDVEIKESTSGLRNAYDITIHYTITRTNRNEETTVHLEEGEFYAK
jgi:phage baseplate assembly protein W